MSRRSIIVVATGSVLGLVAVVVLGLALSLGDERRLGAISTPLPEGAWAFGEVTMGGVKSVEGCRPIGTVGQQVGFKQTTSHPDGTVTVVERSGYTYNAQGQPVGFKETTAHPNGSQTSDVASFEYNALGQPVGFKQTTRHPDGTVTVVERSGYTYNAQGQPVGFNETTTHPDGSQTHASFEYNALGQAVDDRGTTAEADASRIGHGEASQHDPAGGIILYTVTFMTACR